MENRIYEKLNSLGYSIPNDEGVYTPSESDKMAISLIMLKVVQIACNECNTDELPTELEYQIIDNIVGEFLYQKKSMGLLDIESLDLTDTVKSISEGDTSITFADGTSQAEQFNILVSYLMRNIDYSDFRKIRW